MDAFEKGSFIVNSDGKVEIDYLFDGGGFEGELGIFSLEGMDSLETGSSEFILEAAHKAISNSLEGSIVIQDKLEGARFETDLGYEINFNKGDYLGVKTLMMTPGDEVAFIFVPNAGIQEIIDNPEDTSHIGIIPAFSISEADSLELSNNTFDLLNKTSQFVQIDNNGTIGLEDVPLIQADFDYNDFVFNVQGLDGNLIELNEPGKVIQQIGSDIDWRSTEVGQEILDYTETSSTNEESISTPTNERDVVYRFNLMNSSIGFYTASEEERDFIQENISEYEYVAESFVSAAMPQNNLNTTEILPVYRFLNTNSGTHFYTSSGIEEQFIINNLPNYVPEGIAYYAYELAQENSIPMYRLYNESLGTHYFTPSITERDNLVNSFNYQLEGNEDGIVHYVESIEI